MKFRHTKHPYFAEVRGENADRILYRSWEMEDGKQITLQRFGCVSPEHFYNHWRQA